MACRNPCERLDSKIIVGKSIYEEGKKYCRRCEVYFLHDGSFCPCCDIRLLLYLTNLGKHILNELECISEYIKL